MPKVREVLAALERIAPRRFAASFDKIGLQVGDPESVVDRAIVSLDRSLAAVAYACESGAQLLLAHHPLIFAPISSVDTRRHDTRTVLALASHGISFIAAHTNWDAASGGVNDALADRLGLTDIQSFGMAAEVSRLKLTFTAPLDAVDAIIDAVSAAGAGVVGTYRRCAFTSPGLGTFEAAPHARPAVGEPGTRTSVEELRVEMILPDTAEGAVAKALRSSHPYEEPAFEFHVLRAIGEQPMGRCGRIPAPLGFRELVGQIEALLGTKALAWGDPERRIRKVAVVGGAADTEWMNAQRAGADVLITGEVKQHIAVEASESGMPIVAAGHYATEQPGVEALAGRMRAELPEVEWVVYEPAPGSAGRPF